MGLQALHATTLVLRAKTVAFRSGVSGLSLYARLCWTRHTSGTRQLESYSIVKDRIRIRLGEARGNRSSQGKLHRHKTITDILLICQEGIGDGICQEGFRVQTKTQPGNSLSIMD